MSDDEGDYEDREDEEGDEGQEAEAEAPAPEDAEDETDDDLGLDENAGSGAEDSDDDEEGPPEAGARGAPARPAPNPLLGVSNAPLTVRKVPPGDRVTDQRLGLLEAAQVIAMRAEQIARGSPHFGAQGSSDPVALATRELFERRTPLLLRRVVGSGPGYEVVEEWSIRDEMVLPPLTWGRD